MLVNPALLEFMDIYDAGRSQVVWTKLTINLETPVPAMQKLSCGEPNSFLLESVEGGAVRGRYSFIGIRPDVIWRCFGDKAEINENADSNAGAFVPVTGGAFHSFRKLLVKSAIDLPDELPPMAAGLVGYMGYDMVRLMENLPATNPEGLVGMPDGMFVRPTVMAIFDNIEDTVILVTPVRPKKGKNADTAYIEAEERLGQCITNLGTSISPEISTRSAMDKSTATVSNMPRDAYYGMVKRD